MSQLIDLKQVRRKIKKKQKKNLLEKKKKKVTESGAISSSFEINQSSNRTQSKVETEIVGATPPETSKESKSVPIPKKTTKFRWPLRNIYEAV